jgi:hypothetical protein
MYSPQRSVVFADSPVAISASNRLILANATGGVIILNLPTAAAFKGRTFIVVKTDASANGITVTPSGGQTINGAATFSVVNQYQVLALFSDGSNWIIAYGIPSGGGGGGSSDFEMVFSGTLSTFQDNLIPAKTKRGAVNVDQLDVELQGASLGQDVHIEFFSGVTSLGTVVVPAGTLSGTLAIMSVTIPAETRVTCKIRQVGTTQIAVTASMFARTV